jgi:hypothetical protein
MRPVVSILKLSPEVFDSQSPSCAFGILSVAELEREVVGRNDLRFRPFGHVRKP